MTLEEAAEVTGGRAVGEPTLELRGVAPLDQAQPDQLGLLAEAGYLGRATTSQAGALLVSAALEASLPEDRARVVVADAHAALIPLLNLLHPEPELAPSIHPTAELGRGVRIGEAVRIGPYAVVGEGVELGDRCSIGAHAVLGDESRVGSDSILHPHVVLYPRTVLGQRVVVHAGARLGVDGFGYVPTDEGFRKVPQVGRCIIEDDVEIGANTCLDRGSIGETSVGKGTKLDNLIHLAHNVRVGAHCAMAAQVGIAGSTHVGRGSVLAGQVGLLGHLEIGEGTRIGAQSGVMRSTPPGQTLFGFPAQERTTYLKAFAQFLRLPELVKRVSKLEKRIEGPETG